MKNRVANTGTILGFERALWRISDELRGYVDPSEYKFVILSLLFEAEIDKKELGHLRQESEVFAGQLNLSRIPAELLKMLRGQVTAFLEEVPEDFDIFGRIYEYFLEKLAGLDGKEGGEFFTPRSIVRLLVSLVGPDVGTVYDPCCGTGGMIIQSGLNGRTHPKAIKAFAQELNPKTWSIARLSTRIQGIDLDLGPRPADSFVEDLHDGRLADFVLSNPPFNMKRWDRSLSAAVHWPFGKPATSNANYAWLQLIYRKLAPGGRAGIVLSNGALSSNRAGEWDIRKAMLEAGVVRCIVSLPSQLFYGTQIPVSIWILERDRSDPLPGKPVLFIEGNKLGSFVTRVHRQLSENDIDRVSDTFQAWRKSPQDFAGEPGFARSASLNEIERHKFALVPGRYVGFSDTERAFGEQDLDLEMVKRRISAVSQHLDTFADWTKRV